VLGPYIFIDKKHPENSGQTVNVGLRDPRRGFADGFSLTIARKLSESMDRSRGFWDRVISNYNRDSDIFLIGIGYCWR